MQHNFIGFVAILTLLIFSACTKNEPVAYERGLMPWVFRSVLDDQARMLTAALHEDLFVAYSAETGALYKAWKGEVDLDGAVYTTAHGPQPESIGKGWTKNPFAKPWFLEINGERVSDPEVRFRGHRIKDGQLHILTELSAPKQGVKAVVTERPEYRPGTDGQVGLERQFTVKGLPDGAAVGLQVAVSGLPYSGSLTTDGTWKLTNTSEERIGDLTAVTVTGELVLNAGAPTTLVAYFVRAPTLANDNQQTGAELAEAREPGEILIERNGCKTCHNTRVKTVGPAYVAIAERYLNTSANVDKLSAKVIKGGAGNWGQAAMTPHDHLPPADIRTMVQWVMDLDKASEGELATQEDNFDNFTFADALQPSAMIGDDGLAPGARAAVYLLDEVSGALDGIDWGRKPDAEGVVPYIDFEGQEWGALEDNFAVRFSGYLKIPETSNYLVRLRSDDGSRLLIDGQEIINHDGYHGPSPMDGEIALAAGNHPFVLDYFEAGGGQTMILEWRSFFNPEWQVVSDEYLAYAADEGLVATLPKPMDRGEVYPGDGTRLTEVHPSYTLRQARPNGFTPKVGGMDFLSDGRLVISTWDAEGAVYLLEGVQSGDPAKITTKKIATGLAEPLGLKVVEDTIFVMQKQELTKLIDHDGDEVIDEYATVSNDWLTTANFHEFGFGLAFKEPYFYATLAIGILPGGASAPNQPASRGKAVRIHRHTGELDYISSGLRTPNGINFAADGELFIADNQGDWLPSSKILHVSEGAFFNSYAVEADETKIPKPPVVWLPQDEIGNSPSTPNYLNDGPYKGQMIHGEVTHGGLKRVFVEKVNGEYQGTVFRFVQGLEAGVNRNVWGPDGALYIGMIGSTGNWGDVGKLFYGLQSIKYNGEPTFEVLAVRTKPYGLEVEFTQPVKAGFGDRAEDIALDRFYYQPTANYGGPKLEETRLPLDGITWSTDRRKLQLAFSGRKPEHVYYLRLPNNWTDEAGRKIWTTESWTTVNYWPEAATR
ncbi:MAG: PA14 domain-containing protein [Bacteroidota bacterium]